MMNGTSKGPAEDSIQRCSETPLKLPWSLGSRQSGEKRLVGPRIYPVIPNLSGSGVVLIDTPLRLLTIDSPPQPSSLNGRANGWHHKKPAESPSLKGLSGSLNGLPGSLNGLPRSVGSQNGSQNGSAPAPPDLREKPSPALGARKSLFSVLATHNYQSQIAVEPRGLQNTCNMCFFNAVLQALVHCRPMYSLLCDIRNNTVFKIKNDTPILAGLVGFSGEYALPATRVLTAERFYRIVCSHPNFRHLEPGRQEDAQEFLGYLLDTLEEDFDNAERTQEDRDLQMPVEEDEQDEWTQVGKSNKKIVALQAGRTDHTNPILSIFGGKLRSELRKAAEPPSVTVESFQQVCVDISAPEISSLQQAVDHMLAVEDLQLEHRSRTVSATKQLQFDRVPPVLIVHVKRFTFLRKGDSFDFGKISKPIAVSNLSIDCKGGAVYTPFAVVYHHGPSATVGHYTADIKVEGQWYNVDDEYVHRLPHGPGESNAAYIVFYERV